MKARDLNNGEEDLGGHRAPLLVVDYRPCWYSNQRSQVFAAPFPVGLPREAPQAFRQLFFHGSYPSVMF